MTHSPKLAALLFAVLSTLGHAQDMGWYNGKTSPYSISTANELKGLQTLVANGTNDFDGKTILLANDIVLSGNWTPIGSDSYPFQGVFDGKGYTISGLSVDVSGNAGFFDYVGANGQIKNINVIATTIKGGGNAGVLAGYYGSSKPIENCSATAESVNGSFLSGGLIGETSAALAITNCYTSVDVSSESYTSVSGRNHSGGLVGKASAALTIANSYASGSVMSRSNAGSNAGGTASGGLVGYAASAATITNSYASGFVFSSFSNGNPIGGASSSGGLVGYAATAIIANSYASGDVVSQAGAGSRAYARSHSGGLVGYVDNAATIANSYASGNVSSRSSVSTSTNNFSYSGGLVGYAANAATIVNNYASGNVSCNSTLDSGNKCGGIFGHYDSGTMTSVYYKSEGASKAAGEGTLTIGVFAISSDNLKKKSNFLNWNFNEIWGIAENYTYPYLKIYPPSNIYIPLNTDLDLELEYIPDQAYTGSQIKPELTVRLKTDGTLLTKGTDYVLSYETNLRTGTGAITITGLNSYIGLLETLSFNIFPKTITISGAAAQNKIYDGTTTATITGTLEGIATGDIAYVKINAGKFASKDAGNAIAVSEVTLTDIFGNYRLIQPTGLTANINAKALTITIEPKTITLAQSDPISNVNNYLVYDGLVPGDTKDLISGTTYLIYDTDKMPILAVPAAGKYKVRLSGSRTATNYDLLWVYDFSEELYLEVIADPVNLSTCTIDIPAQTYTGSQIQPTISVTCGTATLTEDDYTIAYGANINAGTIGGTVTLTGKGAYTGTKTETFAIDKKALTVTGAAAEDKVYDGTTAATITGAELEGVIGTDAVSLANHTAGTFASANAGEDIAVSTNMSLAGTAAGNYSVTQPSDLKASITPKALPADAIQAIAAQTHTGTEITPAITVKDGSSTLANGADYTAEFADNIDVGTATVIVTGKGNYSGTATANFTINARPSSSSVAVTPSSSSVTLSYSSDTVIPSSSSTIHLSSSSATQPSSSSSGGVPIRLPQIAASNQATQIHNGISLHATSKAVVEVYGLDGNLVSRQSFGSGVYAVSFGHLPKGMYIVKAAFGSEKKMLKVPVR